MKYQKGLIQIVLIIGIFAALAVIGYVLYSQRLNSLTGGSLYNPSSIQAVAPIQSSKDLSGASTSLDSTDVTQLDAQLNALNSASSGF